MRQLSATLSKPTCIFYFTSRLVLELASGITKYLPHDALKHGNQTVTVLNVHLEYNAVDCRVIL